MIAMGLAALLALQVTDQAAPAADPPQTIDDGIALLAMTFDNQLALKDCKVEHSGSATAEDVQDYCTVFGRAQALRALFPADAARIRRATLRVALFRDDAAPLPLPGDVAKVLSHARYQVAPDGQLGACEALAVAEVEGRRLDLCTQVNVAETRVAPGRRSATFSLLVEIAASFGP